ncbi:hypothetical protein [Flavobacterium oreochromis]|uniref:Uncharacterized protein n=2 Tax=Flavobacterium TaxID=237 RepID=A0A246G954_9FLAO|nr:hypothetical protein [Flavobacterium oreochromis]OWP75638.1 hypothetical protein BWG23_10350 [Flavobacterium oreochromis]OWP75883.1 hypothetical protein BWK62_11030 [Flavobacterium oreochromis]POR21976.1 hypothetical protein BWK58_11680 [Flavobacterium columnare]
MDSKNYLQDIKDIKQMMSQSSQFISLSGLAGVLAGIYALIGASYVHLLLQNCTYSITIDSLIFKKIIITAIIVLISSLTTAFLTTLKKAKRIGEKIWNNSSKQLFINFIIPLMTGGIFSLLLMQHGYFGLIAPIMLLFYGLACLNASKYTLRDIRYLGLTEIILGLLSAEFIGYGLYFWIIGFGICHILYGGIMYYKYDRK